MSDFEPAADRDLDTAALRQALGCFVTGVTVVTTRDAGGAPRGFTANSFTSVSLRPPLVLVCVGNEALEAEVYRDCPEFAINVLGDAQQAVSDRFATDRGDRFAGLRWREGSRGSPILEGSLASLECASWRRIDAGDHMILIGRVLAFEHATEHATEHPTHGPLAYFRGRYVKMPA